MRSLLCKMGAMRNVSVKHLVALALAGLVLVGLPLLAFSDVPDAGSVAAMVDAGPAEASPEIHGDPSAHPEGWVKEVYTAVSTSNWVYVAALVLLMLVAVLKRYGARYWDKLSSPLAGALMAGGLALMGAVVNGLAAGMDLSLDMVLTGLRVGMMAAVPYFLAMSPPKPKE